MIDEDPDGIPHVVIGLTALFSVGVATALVILLVRIGDRLPTVASATLATLMIVTRLARKAARDRSRLQHSTRAPEGRAL